MGTCFSRRAMACLFFFIFLHKGPFLAFAHFVLSLILPACRPFPLFLKPLSPLCLAVTSCVIFFHLPWPHSSDFLSHCLLVTSISYCFPQLRYRTSILIIRYQRECAQKEIYCPPLRLQCCPFCFSACQGDFPVSWRGRDHFQLIVRVGVWIIDHQIILVQFILFFKSS